MKKVTMETEKAFMDGFKEAENVYKPILEQERMNLRDQFAMAALQGWLSTYDADSMFPTRLNDLATDMYMMADAMLEARKQK